MTDERPTSAQGPEEVGADTGKFRAFVREGDQQPERPSNAFRLLTLALGLAVLAGVIYLLLR
jgi:hypothetical protein